MICIICLNNINNNDESISCENITQCNFHIECFNSFLNNIIIPDNNIKISWKEKKLLCCPNYTCCNSYIARNKMLNSSIKDKCVDIFLNLENIITTENIIKNQININTNININTIMNDIKNILVTAISCPKCKIPFIDFSGCLALTCSNCRTLFCGVCLTTHFSINNSDLHNNVRLCLEKFDTSIKKMYQIHSEYFISNQGWIILKDDIKFNAILKYLKSIDFKIVFSLIDDIMNIMNNEKLLEKNYINKIPFYFFGILDIKYHKYHILYLQLYLLKYNFDIEDFESLHKLDCILSEKEKYDLYQYIFNKEKEICRVNKIKKIKKGYYIKNTPSIIIDIINEWGVENKKWNI
jgi:hypothetical protein